MSQTPGRRRHRAPLLTVIAAILVIALAGIVYLIIGGDDAPDSPPTESSTAAPTSASGSADFSLPDDAAPVSFTFELEDGQSALLELTVAATFEASTEERRALYTIIGMSCGSVDGPTNTQSANGTENLIHQETRQVTQVISYEATSSGEHRCNAQVNAPDWDPEYGDAELSLEATIRPVADLTAPHEYTSAAAEQPIVLESGESTLVIDETFPFDPGPDGVLEVLSGTHLTACTIKNGSRDQTEENLCTEGLLDRDGSTVTTRTVVEQLDGDTVCRTVTADQSLTEIDHLVHHRLLDSRTSIDGFTAEPCGDRIRLRHHVSNEGPAALVVHRSSTRAAIVVH
jgi:hypothetical protein